MEVSEVWCATDCVNFSFAQYTVYLQHFSSFQFGRGMTQVFYLKHLNIVGRRIGQGTS